MVVLSVSSFLSNILLVQMREFFLQKKVFNNTNLSKINFYQITKYIIEYNQVMLIGISGGTYLFLISDRTFGFNTKNIKISKPKMAFIKSET